LACFAPRVSFFVGEVGYAADSVSSSGQAKGIRPFSLKIGDAIQTMT